MNRYLGCVEYIHEWRAGEGWGGLGVDFAKVV
jgi:hypothetical protein